MMLSVSHLTNEKLNKALSNDTVGVADVDKLRKCLNDAFRWV
jgi:hypothetical protein